MPSILVDEYPIKLRFGGGLNTRASSDDIRDDECARGENFNLDLEDKQFVPRRPFDLIGTVPNAGEIRGMAGLLKSNGAVSLLIQADDTVYEWDGATTFTSRGTVNSSAKLRGHLNHNFILGDYVIITDLELAEAVMKWDGTTLSTITFTDETVSGAFGNFFAKYCHISDERAIFANVKDNATPLPHAFIGSMRSDPTIITTSQKPASSLGPDDPFWMLQPDLKAINGVAEVFGVVATSSQFGNMYRLEGSSSKDFSFTQLFPRSGAVGDEAVVYVGNDIFFGRQGRIESLVATDRFGNVQTDDISRKIADQVDDVTQWTIAYNSRLDRVYLYPESGAKLWVYHKALHGSDLSPWSLWRTGHTSSFNPTCMMPLLDPSDGKEYVFFGDSSGNFYRLEGVGSDGDGGSNSIRATRVSKLVHLPLSPQGYRVDGYALFRQGDSFQVDISLEWAGFSAYDETISFTTPQVADPPLYGGEIYYGEDHYYGALFEGRLLKRRFPITGESGEFQIRITVTGTTTFEIAEIGLRIEATTQ